MSDHVVLPPRETLPTRAQALAFHGKATIFRLRRFWQDAVHGRPPRLLRGNPRSQRPIVATARGPLYASGNPAEFALQAGKVQNLRIAARALHGLEIPS